MEVVRMIEKSSLYSFEKKLLPCLPQSSTEQPSIREKLGLCWKRSKTGDTCSACALCAEFQFAPSCHVYYK